MKIIEITVNSKGESKIETKGFRGGDCRQASRFIEQALGQRAAEEHTHCREYHLGEQASQELTQSQ